jgi:hypothetical protein
VGKILKFPTKPWTDQNKIEGIIAPDLDTLREKIEKTTGAIPSAPEIKVRNPWTVFWKRPADPPSRN